MTTLSDALAAYRIYAKTEGKSPKTVRFIIQSVNYFGAFLGENQSLTNITANDLRRLIIALRDSNKFSNHPFNKPIGIPPAFCIS